MHLRCPWKAETMGIRDGFDVGNEGKGEAPGLTNYLQCNAIS